MHLACNVVALDNVYYLHQIAVVQPGPAFDVNSRDDIYKRAEPHLVSPWHRPMWRSALVRCFRGSLWMRAKFVRLARSETEKQIYIIARKLSIEMSVGPRLTRIRNAWKECTVLTQNASKQSIMIRRPAKALPLLSRVPSIRERMISFICLRWTGLLEKFGSGFCRRIINLLVYWFHYYHSHMFTEFNGNWFGRLSC